MVSNPRPVKRSRTHGKPIHRPTRLEIAVPIMAAIVAKHPCVMGSESIKKEAERVAGGALIYADALILAAKENR